jgi:hypothetical protein
MREKGSTNLGSKQFRERIVAVIRSQPDENKRTLNELARAMILTEGNSLEKTRDHNIMLGRLSYHLEKLEDMKIVAKDIVKEGNVIRFTIYSIREEGKK